MKANRGVSQVESSPEGERSPQQGNKGMIKLLFNTNGRHQRNSRKQGRSCIQPSWHWAEWTQGSRGAVKMRFFLGKEEESSELTSQREGFQWKEQRTEEKTEEVTDMQNLRTIGPRCLIIMADKRVRSAENQPTVTLLKHGHGSFYFWFLVPTPISHFLVAFASIGDAVSC